jgi:hypothetical protein
MGFSLDMSFILSLTLSSVFIHNYRLEKFGKIWYNLSEI